MSQFETLPGGTVTFLFTDIEGSTRLWERQPEAMESALAEHDAILRQTIESNRGVVFKTVGDAFCAAFISANDALSTAHATQQALQSPLSELEIKVRIALHTGVAQQRDGDYFGPALNQVARLLSAGHGGQILLSPTTERLVRNQLAEGFAVRDLGEKRLKDLDRPLHIFQLIAPDLPTEFAPLRTLDAVRHNLPVQPTPLVGREKDLAAARDLILDPLVRLLTLTGPGGTGKTRLGLQLAAGLTDAFHDGVCFVPLAAVTDPALVVGTIAHSLGIREQGHQEARRMLVEDLHKKMVLLLLDNFEQVVESAPEIAHLLENAPGIKVIVTSREILQLRAEREFPVPPLSPPALSGRFSLKEVAGNPAVDLFVSRAQSVRPGFELTEANGPAVAEICQRLDGLPLAIELAAARVKLLSPQAMLKRLGSTNGRGSLRLLSGGMRDAPSRHRALKATIAWSYDLLEPEEQVLFRRLSIFNGSFNLMAAEEICDPWHESASNLPPLALDIMEGIASLLNKSLLRQAADVEGEGRFAMLEMIREYAQEQLTRSGEVENLSRLHAAYFHKFAQEASAQLEGEEAAQWLAVMDAEIANLRAALSRSIAQDEPTTAAALAIPLGLFWLMRGRLTEGRGWFDQILALEKLRQEREVYANVLDRAGFLASYQGDYAEAARLTEACLAVRRELGVQHPIADSLALLGFVRLRQGQYGAALALNQEALETHRQIGNDQGIADATSNLSIVAFHQREFRLAEALARECMALWEGLGDVQGVAWASQLLGKALTQLGENQEAEASFWRCLNLATEIGHRWGQALAFEGLAILAAQEGRWKKAITLAGGAAAIRYAIGLPFSTADGAHFEEALKPAYSNLSQMEAQEAYQVGQSHDLEALIACALE